MLGKPDKQGPLHPIERVSATLTQRCNAPGAPPWLHAACAATSVDSVIMSEATLANHLAPKILISAGCSLDACDPGVSMRSRGQRCRRTQGTPSTWAAWWRPNQTTCSRRPPTSTASPAASRPTERGAASWVWLCSPMGLLICQACMSKMALSPYSAFMNGIKATRATTYLLAVCRIAAVCSRAQ